MSKSMLMTFVDENFKLGSKMGILPLFHSCEGYTGIEIFKEGILRTTKCKFFDKDLLYFFYGKPSYPVAEKFPKSRTDVYYCPICFVVNLEKVLIYKIYPFDTGAFKTGKYADFIHRGVELENYKLDSNIDAIQSYIEVMFGNNDNYLNGKCIQSEYDLAEIDVLVRMLNANGTFDIDERSNTIEVISHNNVDIKDMVECVILPNNIMRERHVKEFFDKNKIKYKTYHYRSLTKPDRYYEAVFQLAMEHIEERGGIDMNKYKLFGFLNMFGIVPDFIFPIFEQKNVLYMQEGENNQLNAIVPLKKELYNKVVSLDKYNDGKYPIEYLDITVTSSPKYAFQVSKNNIIYGDSKILMEYLEFFSTDDEILKQEINDFRADVGYIIESHLLKKEIRFYGTGRRKTSVARVYLVPGTGKITINKRDIDEYLGLETLKITVRQPLEVTKTTDKYDVLANVRGGGFSGQAGAIRHGISRALLQVDADFKPVLKEAGYLTRDSRMKERKKYGLKSARRAPQFSKR